MTKKKKPSVEYDDFSENWEVMVRRRGEEELYAVPFDKLAMAVWSKGLEFLIDSEEEDGEG